MHKLHNSVDYSSIKFFYTPVPSSRPITSWQIDGETVERAADFIFLGSKITADGDCSNEIKRCLLLRRKVMSNLDGILRRDTTLSSNVMSSNFKGSSSQGYGFSSSHEWM